MKICRYTLVDDPSPAPRLGLAADDGIRDISEVLEALPQLRWPFPRGDQFITHLAELRPALAAAAKDKAPLPLDAVSLLSPVANPGKIICGAGNWKHHGAPLGMLGFMFKATSAVVGAGEGVHIRWPEREIWHEPELAVVIGRTCTMVEVDEALDYVAGYACAFDTTLKSEREDAAFCKSFDTFGTLGPWLVTADEIADPSQLSYRFWVNGEQRGERQFADLTGSPAEMIAFASSAMTLYPGDVIMSGAADVGPIHDGETMTIEIPGIGRMSTKISISPHVRAVG